MNEEQARRQVRKERAFYAGLASYVVVCSMLAVINLLTSPEYFWAVWPILGWGVGVVSQGLSTFGIPGRKKDWEERRVRELMGEEGSAQRLRTLVDEAVERRERPRRGTTPTDPESARLRERIEHLEAIVTSRDWDLLEHPAGSPAAAHTAPPTPALEIPEGDAPADETAEARAARLAGRVR